MAQQICPSCKNNKKIETIEKIDINQIIDHYNNTGFDTEYLFDNHQVLTLYKCPNCELKYFYPVILGDSRYYSHLQKEDWYFVRADRYEYEYASTLVTKDDNVLDIGCGRGVFSRYIDCNFYQGLEFSTKALELAKEDGTNVMSETIEKHCQEKEGFYDIVTMFEVLEHLYDIDEFLSCAIKCLKPGGKFIISVPNNDGFIKYSKNNFLNMPPHHVTQWNKSSLTKLCEFYPLKISSIKIEKVANIHKEWYWGVQLDKIKNLGKKFKSTGPVKKNLLGKIATLLLKPLFFIGKTVNIQKFFTGQGIVIVLEKTGD